MTTSGGGGGGGDSSTTDSDVPARDWTFAPASAGARSAVDDLVVRHYDELRLIAHARLRRERPGDTLQTTGLVSEAYLRLTGVAGLGADEKTRFFALMSTTMRRVLVDHARSRARLKRGAGVDPVPLGGDEGALAAAEAEELLALDEALTRLERINPRGSDVVQHRFFGGLTLEETAALLGVSAKTVQRDWRAARAWLRKEMERELGMLGAIE
jgi:RNA polymerase sigma factor (TIGR02999 family)